MFEPTSIVSEIEPITFYVEKKDDSNEITKVSRSFFKRKRVKKAKNKGENNGRLRFDSNKLETKDISNLNLLLTMRIANN